MSDIELRLGKMTEAEIAEWRGVTEASLHKNFSKYEKEFEEYCSFVRYKEGRKYAGIDIKEIYNEIIYINKGSKDYERMKEFIPNHIKENPSITTGTWMAICYLEKYPDAKIQQSTASVYARQICKEWYPKEGIINSLTSNRKGNEKGYYERVVGLSFDGKPRLLTKEEEQLKEQLYERFIINPLKNKKAMNEIILNVEDGRKQNFDLGAAYFQLKDVLHDETGGWLISGRKYKDYIEWDKEEKFEF